MILQIVICKLLMFSFLDMYKVVEFTDDAGGGVSVVKEEWLTPQKHRCLWPPQHLIKKFNKCIDGSISPDKTWDIFNIKRVFYETG